MSVEPLIGLGDQGLVEPLLRHPRLVARDQKDRLPFGIERVSHPPHPIIRLEPQLLHVGMFGAGERVGMRAAKLRAEDLKQGSRGKQFVVHRLRQGFALGVEVIVIDYRPRHDGDIAFQLFLVYSLKAKLMY